MQNEAGRLLFGDSSLGKIYYQCIHYFKSFIVSFSDNTLYMYICTQYTLYLKHVVLHVTAKYRKETGIIFFTL